MTEKADALKRVAAKAKAWLLDQAAPRWADDGRTETGLFAERLSLTGDPDEGYFRTLVQARHVYAFTMIGQLGWQGPWQELIEATLTALIGKAKRDDGLFVHSLDRSARPLDDRADLYDQAFILLAFGAAGAALRRPDLFDEAEALLDVLEMRWAHPAGGFYEGEIANSRIRRQNPHMHLLEAFIVIHEASGRGRFLLSAKRIANLALDKFMQLPSGALTEFFTDDLSPAPGEEGMIVEPGHCFEWAWLFESLNRLQFGPAIDASDRLVRFARGCGLNSESVVINSVLTDRTVRDAAARLWPQGERLKAAASRYTRKPNAEEAAELISATAALGRFLETPRPGLWRDKLQADGRWVEELAPGSSLYHIVGAIAELVTAAVSRRPKVH